MFSWISDSEQHHNDYELARMKRIKQNNAMAVKLDIKGLESSLDAMQCNANDLHLQIHAPNMILTVILS